MCSPTSSPGAFSGTGSHYSQAMATDRFSASDSMIARRQSSGRGVGNLIPFSSGPQFPRVGLCEEAGQVLL